MPWNMKHKRKFEYIWKVGDILKTTRDIILDSDTIRKGSIVKIESRNQGYNCISLRPAYFNNLKFCVTDTSAFQEIGTHDWISILNDK